MSKALAQILAQWMRRSSQDSGPYPEPHVGSHATKPVGPRGRGPSISLHEPEPELYVRALRQGRRTR
jgi:hypothetical protein